MVEPHLFNPEDVIVERGQPPESIWFICSGTCSVLLPKFKKRGERVISVLQRGDSFG